MDSELKTTERTPTFPVRLNPERRWLLDQLAISTSRTRGGLIKFWIDREAKKAGLSAPKEIITIEK